MEKYRRIRVLGQGTCSKVFLVQDSDTGENCVVKQIEAPLSGQQRDSALQEAALLRVLSHPNIVGYREAFVTRSGFICLIMEYAQGGDMHHLLQQRSRASAWFSELQVLNWMSQLCNALQYLHERNVVHRDIKARNIFLQETGDAKLGDFGISTVVDSPDDQLRSAIGTPSYASPERMRKRPYGASADVWSLGVVFYEICALRKPFEGETLASLAEKIVAGQYEPLDERRYSSDLRQVVSDMLAYEPCHRPTAGQICELPLLQMSPGHAPQTLPPLVVPVHLQNRSQLSQDPPCAMEPQPRPKRVPVVERAASTENMETLLLPTGSEHGDEDSSPGRVCRPSCYPPPLTEHYDELGVCEDVQVPEFELLDDADVRSNFVEGGDMGPSTPKAAWSPGTLENEQCQHGSGFGHALSNSVEEGDMGPNTPKAAWTPGTLEREHCKHSGGFGHALLHGARRLFGLDGHVTRNV